MAAEAQPLNGNSGYECMAGGGQMGEYMRSLDWSSTPLGPVSQWPQSLRTSVSTCLNSRFAILIWWGPELVMIYNDAYREIIAGKHPAAMGRPGRECWPEIWHIIGPMLEGVLVRGEATWSDDLLLMLERRGYAEECYFTFSYSPIRDESGGIGGVFTPVAETTDHIIGARRMRTLRDLAVRGGKARDTREACRIAAETLAVNPHGITFACLYLFEGTQKEARLAGVTGVTAGSAVAPLVISEEDPRWAPLAETIRTPRMTVVADLSALFGPLPGGAWSTPTRSGVVLPILLPGQNASIGFALAGVNPHKRLDSAYSSFFELVGSQISSAVAEARAYEEERAKADALAELDRAKTVFFSNVSHEFRTPLTLMLGPLEEMMERGAQAAVTREELELVHRNGLRLLKLVNTLLDFSRIEAGRVQAAYAPVDLAALTTDLASAFHSAMERAGLAYVIDCPALADPVYVDRDMWEKIVLNLISNAFKFTFAGRVTVRLRAVDGWVELSVSDTGVGIPAQELPRVFDRFHRVEGVSGRTHEGSGIGLAFVQELAKLHGGSVRVESAAGSGSTFTVAVPQGHGHLPREQVAPAGRAAPASAGVSAWVNEALRWLPEGAEPRLPPFASDSLQAPHHEDAGARILLADDNADMREYVRRLLAPHYTVEAVGNGLQALASARRSQPDLILSDMMMPGLDGFGLLRELRAGEDTRTIPIILLSARAGEDARIEGLEAGADDYLVKPFTARELLARVGAHLGMSRLRSEAAVRERSLRAEAEAARERADTVLESISDGFIAIDREWRFTYANSTAERNTGIPRADWVGKVLWELFPDLNGTELEQQYRRAMYERVVTHGERYNARLQKWFEVRVYPARDGGISVFFQDVTERKRAEESIRRTNEALAAANADLEQFAWSASHDLREPLRTVKVYCELLRKRYAENLDARAREMVDFCVDGAARMDALINDLLVYVRASSAAGVEVTEAVPLGTALAQALTSLRTPIEESGAMIHEDPLPPVRMATVHAEQILQNLVGNALKYRGPAPPLVHVGAVREGNVWVVSVRDNGIGIAPEYHSHVFGLFKRLHSGSEYSGSGLGLAICRRLVERYGGRMWLESELGLGSTFFFSIPDRAG